MNTNQIDFKNEIFLLMNINTINSIRESTKKRD